MRTVVLVVALALALAGCTGPTTPQSTPPSASAAATPAPAPSPTPTGNWVQLENQRPGTTDWRIRDTANDTELAGYADHASARPGDRVGLRVTTTAPTFVVRAYRLGDYGGTGGRLVWESGALLGVQQPKPTVDAQNMVSATNWSESLALDTADWPEGSYLLKLVGSTGKQKYVPLTLRSADMRGKVVLVSATATYQAYNEYGGYSLYRGRNGFDDRARRVSFDRPYDRQGARLVIGYEQPVIKLAESLGLDLAYTTNLDLEAGLQAYAGAAGLVSPGHDEYWSTRMRQTVESLRDSGTNLAFLGANSVYWRIRFSDSPLGPGRIVDGWKSAAEDPIRNAPDTTAMWRQAPNPVPENSLVGMLYECFPAKGALVVQDPDFFLYAGTGARRGSSYAGLIGVEIDRAYPIAGTPPNLQVVAHSPVQCGTLGTTYADVTYYTTPSGAGVFAAGTMYWTKGLSRPAESDTGIDDPAIDFATTVTTNLFRAMAAGPLGRTHPARGNLDALGASASTRTGSGGAVG